MLILTSGLFLALLLWQSYSSSDSHQKYQLALMDSVTDRVLSDYQEYFNQLRLEIDLFQQTELNALSQLHEQGSNASASDYKKLLAKLKQSITHTRLFALIDQKGQGTLAHITGDFLPSCKEEVHDTLRSGVQENIFLHHSKSSVHFDLLQPLLVNDSDNHYLFVAFNPNVLQALLYKYQLPHQELFLLRSDHVGKIELTSEKDQVKYQDMTLSQDEIDLFSFVKEIPGTRWQLAIRLEQQYSRGIYATGFIKALIIWILLTFVIYIFYRMQRYRVVRQSDMHAQLQYKDQHDKLTGLANRANFESQLATQIEQKRTESATTYGVVLLIDIDQFQIINNNYGYAIGDKILFNLSLAFTEFLPQDTLISRLGNDEFAVLLPTLFHHSAKSYADKLRSFLHKVELADIDAEMHITASIGAVILDGEQQDVEQVLSCLNMSVSLAKQKGRNRVQVYQSDDKQLLQHAQEMDAVHHLSDAMKNKQLVLYRQQIAPLNDDFNGKHYEVLVRINSNEQIIAPGAFIPAAEKYGLIKKLDRYIITMTLDAVSQELETDTCYSINLSGTTLADPDTFNFVKASFEQFRLDPKRICFEITETSAISHLKSALRFINKTTELGCTFALDDFGSGLSSFSYLQQLPVSIIKIDGVFIKDIHQNHVNRIFVENIQRTAIAMNKRTVAEFVESEQIQQVLTDIGVHFGQGYHIHKPEPWFEYLDKS